MADWLARFAEDVRPWDEEAVIQLWVSEYEQLNKTYPTGALEWTEANRPDLLRELTKAETEYDRTFTDKDMVGTIGTIDTLKAALNTIINEFKKTGVHCG